MSQLTVLMPSLSRENVFWWPELRVAESGIAGAGLGVFATRNLPRGLCIPVVGRRVSAAEARELIETERAQYLFQAPGQFLDGRVADGRGADGRGAGGLEIALLANEPPPRTKANCAFGNYTLQLRRPVAEGEELFVHYGNGYHRDYHVGQRRLHLKETAEIRKKVRELWNQV